jgi:hypothetical protein
VGVTAALRHQGGAEHSRSAYAFDRPKWVCLSHAHRHARTHLESPQRFCTAEIRGSTPLGSTSRTRSTNGFSRQTKFFNLSSFTLLLGVGGGQVGAKSAPSVSSCNRSSFVCRFFACFGLPLRLNSCISFGHDSRAASAVSCSPRCTTCCLTFPFSR